MRFVETGVLSQESRTRLGFRNFLAPLVATANHAGRQERAAAVAPSNGTSQTQPMLVYLRPHVQAHFSSASSSSSQHLQPALVRTCARPPFTLLQYLIARTPPAARTPRGRSAILHRIPRQRLRP
ncbi:hypothetical protein PSPO01_12869 [Paraphaeosphaeria sporulosa]